MTAPCSICGGRGMIPDIPTGDYRPHAIGWTRCTCPPDPWHPAMSLSEVDDYIAAQRAAAREITQ